MTYIHPHISLTYSEYMERKCSSTKSLPMKRNCSSTKSLPWEVIALVSDHFDTRTASIASCVSKSWNKVMSSDYLWKRFCHIHYPSLSKLHTNDHSATFSYRSLYTMAFNASKLKTPIPSKPQLFLNDIVFAIDLHGAVGGSGLTPISITKPCSELNVNGDALFLFDIVFDHEEEDVKFLKNKGGDDIKVTWNIVKKDWKIFTMIDGASKQTGGVGLEKVFTKELPATGCCLNAAESSGIMAELRLQFGKERLEKMSLGLMNTHSWRYVSVDDGLRYLQHFLDRDHLAPKEKC